MVQTQSESESEDETSVLAQAIRQELSLTLPFCSSQAFT